MGETLGPDANLDQNITYDPEHELKGPVHIAGIDGPAITWNEYHALQRDSRKLRAIRAKMDEYHMRKKLVAERISEDHLHKLRRKTLNEIAALLHRKDA